MKILFRNLVFLGVIFLTPGWTFGWGAVEHKVIAYIAWQNLTPATRAAVVELMMRAPPDSGVGALRPDNSATDESQLRFFVAASVWADLVRNPTKADRQMKYSCPLWHYAEFTFGEAGVEVPDLPAFKPRQVNVMERLQFFQNALVDEEEPISNRAIELVWTIHLVGDIHQPLHIASRVTQQEPESDLGGNRFKLGTRNLHGYWDLVLVEHYRRTENETEDSYIKRLADQVVRKYPRADLADRLTHIRPDEWAAESFELAKSVVYPGVTRFHQPAPEYDRRALEVGQLRIALAGYRLAQLLNRLFGTSTQRIAATSAMSADTKKIKARLDYDLACVASTLDDKTRGLQLVKGTALEGQIEGRQVEGLDSDQVKRIVGETRDALLESLTDEELAGLRAYAIKQFPDASKLETVRISQAPPATLLPPSEPHSPSFMRTHLDYHYGPPGTDIALLSSVNNLIGRVRGLISGIRRSGPISLAVVTRPQTGANIVLQAPGGKRYATSTNSHISDFWPGTYSFTVTKDGFVTIAHSNVDLGFGNSVIDCQLVNSGTAVLCQFR